MNASAINLVKKGHVFSSVYKNGLSNHLPMALYALDFLGADSGHIQDFYRIYEKRLEKPRSELEPVKNVSNFLGKKESFLSLVTYFNNRIATVGIQETIKAHMGALSSGVSGAAFHPLIRLAFALEMGDLDEISHALASWVISFQDLGDHGYRDEKFSLKDSLSHLRENFDPDRDKISARSIFERLRLASSLSYFSEFSQGIHLDSQSLPEMSKLLLNLYLSTDDDFTALHGLTSCHALRILDEKLEISSPNLWNHYWIAIGASYISMGCPVLNFKGKNEESPHWSTIIDQAKISFDPHVIKFVFTCLQEYKFYGSHLYQLAAAKKVKLV